MPVVNDLKAVLNHWPGVLSQSFFLCPHCVIENCSHTRKYPGEILQHERPIGINVICRQLIPPLRHHILSVGRIKLSVSFFLFYYFFQTIVFTEGNVICHNDEGEEVNVDLEMTYPPPKQLIIEKLPAMLDALI